MFSDARKKREKCDNCGMKEIYSNMINNQLNWLVNSSYLLSTHTFDITTDDFNLHLSYSSLLLTRTFYDFMQILVFHAFPCYEGHPINKLHNGIIPLIFKI